MKVSAKTQRHQELRKWFEAAVRDGTPERFYSDFQEAIQGEKDIESRFSVRELCEQFVPDGREFVRMCDPTYGSGMFVESATNVDTGAFAQIFGQIVYTRTMEEFDSPELIGHKLVEIIDTRFNGERLPGVVPLGDDVEIVGEGDPYPNAVFGEEYIETPETIKRGLIVNITKEVVFFDQMGVVLREAATIGKTIAINREKRILDAVLGISTIYRENGQPAQATYQTDNTMQNPLIDYLSMDKVNQLFSGMKGSNGEPIIVPRNTIIVPKSLEMTANRILNATMTRFGTQTGNLQTYSSGNGVDGPFSVITSPYVSLRSGSDTTWFAGDFNKAFVYMQNWAAKVDKVGANSERSFENDIVARYKVSERGAPAVRSRKHASKHTV